MEVYVLVERKQNPVRNICGVALLVIGIVVGVIGLLGVLVFVPFAIAAIAGGWILKNANYEYEYSYFDGEFRFARIANKSKRKELRTYSVEELCFIAPIDDRAAYQYMNDAKSKKFDYTSNQSENKVYVMVAKTDSDMHVIQFEPDEKYLDAVCMKYAQKVKR